MKIDVEAYETKKDRYRRNIVEIEQKVEKYPEAHRDISSYIMNLKSFITEINEGLNGCQVRSMEDDFGE